MPPLLSFVLVADGGRADLEAAAASLLGPELADLEVLVVGDAPGLAALTASDPRVRLVPRPPGDVAAARDLALDTARGDWVWFLEPGDRPAPGTIAGVAERLRASEPDVLLAGRGAHPPLLDRVARDGVTTLERRPGLADAAPGPSAGGAERRRPSEPGVLPAGRGAHRRLLDRVARDGVTTLERRPGLADAAPGLADKVLNRELLRRLEVRFSAGPHGELPVI